MWFHHQTKQPRLYLVVDDDQAALITWAHTYGNLDYEDNNQNTTHPFSVASYTELPHEWFLHGVPWHISSFTTYLNSYITQHSLKQPLLICACNGATTYEKTVSLAHTPTQAAIPPDTQYAHYAWHATALSALQEFPTTHATTTTTFEIPTPLSTQETSLAPLLPQEESPNITSYLVNGMPHSDILRLRLCADKSNCTLHRVTTIRSSMQPLYTYCQNHGIMPENNTISNETVSHTTTPTNTLLNALCAPLPETHNHRLVLSALGLSLFERKLI